MLGTTSMRAPPCDWSRGEPEQETKELAGGIDNPLPSQRTALSTVDSLGTELMSVVSQGIAAHEITILALSWRATRETWQGEQILDAKRQSTSLILMLRRTADKSSM